MWQLSPPALQLATGGSKMRLRELSPSSITARAIAKAISGTEPPANSPKEVRIADLFDLAV
jgi:hypothetical protein